jgi:hypothetical protein
LQKQKSRINNFIFERNFEKFKISKFSNNLGGQLGYSAIMKYLFNCADRLAFFDDMFTFFGVYVSESNLKFLSRQKIAYYYNKDKQNLVNKKKEMVDYVREYLGNILPLKDFKKVIKEFEQLEEQKDDFVKSEQDQQKFNNVVIEAIYAILYF